MKYGSIELFQTQGRLQNGACRTDASHRFIGEALLQIGIKPHFGGFDVLCDGIRSASEAGRSCGVPFCEQMESTLPALRERSGWEHAMRDAIDAGFLRTEEARAQLGLFPDRPGNAEFVCTLAALVRDCIASKKRPARKTPVES